MLMAYHWPGNVRELQNVMERAVLVCDGDVLHAHHLPPTLQMADTSDAAAAQSLDHVARGVREGPDPGRAQDGARQPRQGGPPAADHLAHRELQDPPLPHRLAPLQSEFLMGFPEKHCLNRRAARARIGAFESCDNEGGAYEVLGHSHRRGALSGGSYHRLRSRRRRQLNRQHQRTGRR